MHNYELITFETDAHNDQTELGIELDNILEAHLFDSNFKMFVHYLNFN